MNYTTKKEHYRSMRDEAVISLIIRVVAATITFIALSKNSQFDFSETIFWNIALSMLIGCAIEFVLLKIGLKHLPSLILRLISVAIPAVIVFVIAGYLLSDFIASHTTGLLLGMMLPFILSTAKNMIEIITYTYIASGDYDEIYYIEEECDYE